MKKLTTGLLSAAVLTSTGILGSGVAATVIAPSAYAQTTEAKMLNPVGYTMEELEKMGWDYSLDVNMPSREDAYELSFSVDAPTKNWNGDVIYLADTTKDLPFTMKIKNTSNSTINLQTDDEKVTDDAIKVYLRNYKYEYTYLSINDLTDGKITLLPGEEKEFTGVVPAGYLASGIESSSGPIYTTFYVTRYDFMENDGIVKYIERDVIAILDNKSSTVGFIEGYVQAGMLVSPDSPWIFVQGIVNPDSKTTPYNTPITFSPLENDTQDTTGGVPSGPPWTKIGFMKTIQHPEYEDDLLDVATLEKVKVIDGKGTFTINDDNTMTFTPEKGYTGDVPTIDYWAATEDENISEDEYMYSYTRSTIDITVLPPQPTASPDVMRTPYGKPVSVDVTSNDEVSEDATEITDLKFIDVEGNPVDTLELKEGVFTKETTLGSIVFTPSEGFTGDVPEVKYQITDDKGRTAESTISIIVGQPPVAENDTWNIDLSDLGESKEYRVNVIDNDSPVEEDVTIDTVELLDKDGNVVDKNDVYNTKGELVGTVTVDPVTHEFVYVFNGENVGEIAPQDYRITTSEGVTADAVVTGKLTETIDATPIVPSPVATDDHATHTIGDSDQTTINLLENDKNFNGKVELLDSERNVVTTVPVMINGVEVGTGVLNDNNEFVITWNDNVVKGEIDPVSYKITNENGASSTASITVTVMEKETTPVDPEDPSDPDPEEPTDPVEEPSDPADPVEEDPEPTAPVVTPTPTPTPVDPDTPVDTTTPPVVVVETPIDNPSPVVKDDKSTVIVEKTTPEKVSSDDSVLVKTGEAVKDNAGAFGSLLLGLGAILGGVFGFRRSKKNK